MAESRNKWMQSAVRKPGSLTAQAQRAGKSISEFCKGKKTGVTARRCNLAKIFRKVRPVKKRGSGNR